MRKREKMNPFSYYNEKISDDARVSEFCVTKIKYSYAYASEILKLLNEDYLHLLSLRKGKKEYLSVLLGTIPLLYI